MGACQECNGGRWAGGPGDGVCSNCEGIGYVGSSLPQSAGMEIECDECNVGWNKNPGVCRHCNGTGYEGDSGSDDDDGACTTSGGGGSSYISSSSSYVSSSDVTSSSGPPSGCLGVLFIICIVFALIFIYKMEQAEKIEKEIAESKARTAALIKEHDSEFPNTPEYDRLEILSSEKPWDGLDVTVKRVRSLRNRPGDVFFRIYDSVGRFTDVGENGEVKIELPNSKAYRYAQSIWANRVYANNSGWSERMDNVNNPLRIHMTHDFSHFDTCEHIPVHRYFAVFNFYLYPKRVPYDETKNRDGYVVLALQYMYDTKGRFEGYRVRGIKNDLRRDLGHGVRYEDKAHNITPVVPFHTWVHLDETGFDVEEWSMYQGKLVRVLK
jgi:hypothetical protein